MNILVTGASRGIGYETVKLFSKDSSNKIIAISRNSDNLNKLKNECNQINKDCNLIVIPFDLANDDINKNLLPIILKEVSHIDILINNAGTLINKPFENFTMEEINYIYNVNVFSVIRLIQSLIEHMGKESKSHILNISSMGGFQSSSKFPGLSIYSSSKAALGNLSECLAEELKDRNISVNCLSLGAVQTEMLNEAFPGYQAPLNSDEMAEFISYFALNGHKFFNGKILPVANSTP